MEPSRLQSARLLPAVRHNDRSSLTGSHTNLHGVTLSFLFEVVRPWFPSSQLLPTLEAALGQQLSRLRPGETLIDGFEGLLRSVNQTLAQIAEQGETDWIGSLSAIIIATDGHDLHFSHTGAITAYLVQSNKIRQITEDTSGGDNHPNRTFANLSSGEVQSSDVLLAANQELYRGLSLDALRRLLSQSTPYASLTAIAKELKRTHQRAGMALITRFGSDQITNEPDVVELERIFEKPHQTVARVATPHAKRALQATKSGAKAIATFATTKAAPAVAHQVSKVTKRKTRAHPEEPLPDIERVYPQATQKVRHITVTKGASRRVISLRLRYGIVAAVVAAILITTTSLALRRNSGGSSETATTERSILQSVDALFTQTQLALDAGSVNEASVTLAEAAAELSAAADQASERDLTVAWERYTALLGKLVPSATLGSARATHAFSAGRDSLLVVNPYILATGSRATEYLRIGSDTASRPLETGSSTISALTSWSTKAAVAAATLTPPGFATLVATTQNTLELKPLSVEGEAVPVSDLSTYASNLYGYDRQSGLTWRYPITSPTALGKGVMIINQVEAGTPRSVSMAIDGGIFFLSNTGSLTRFEKGKVDTSFSLKQPEAFPSFTQPARVFTNDKLANIYVLDRTLASSGSVSRILQYSKRGEFVRQIIVPAGISPVDIHIDEQTKQIYLLTDSAVLEFEYPG